MTERSIDLCCQLPRSQWRYPDDVYLALAFQFMPCWWNHTPWTQPWHLCLSAPGLGIHLDHTLPSIMYVSWSLLHTSRQRHIQKIVLDWLEAQPKYLGETLISEGLWCYFTDPCLEGEGLQLVLSSPWGGTWDAVVYLQQAFWPTESKWPVVRRIARWWQNISLKGVLYNIYMRFKAPGIKAHPISPHSGPLAVAWCHANITDFEEPWLLLVADGT